MPDTSAVLTDLVLVISEGTIERGKLAELVTLVIVLSFGCRGRLTYNINYSSNGHGDKVTHRFDDFVDHANTGCNFVI